MATKPIEKRVSDLEEMVDDIPRLINLRFAFVRAQLETLDARVSTVDVKVDRLGKSWCSGCPRLEAKVDARLSDVESNLGARLSAPETKVDALPRTLAEMLDGRAKRGG
jgi:hypothetical protein